MDFDQMMEMILASSWVILVYYGFIKPESERRKKELWRMRNFIQKTTFPEIFSVAGEGDFYVSYLDGFGRRCVDYFKNSKDRDYQVVCVRDNGWGGILIGVYFLSDWRRWVVEGEWSRS